MSVDRFHHTGHPVIPAYPRSKRPVVAWRKYQTDLPSDAQVRLWFRPGSPYNAALVCGWHGLTVLDFDSLTAYGGWLSWAIANGGTAATVARETYRVKTARGVHVYLYVDDNPGLGKMGRGGKRGGGYREPWGEVRGRGAYVLIPPSIHPSGAAYTPMDEAAPICSVQTLADVLPEVPADPLPAAPKLNLSQSPVFATSSLMPGDATEELKRAYPILDWFPGAKPSGNGFYLVRCPWHQDSAPSMWINTIRGICGCYAGCTPKPLDTVGVFAKIQGLTNREAYRELAQRAGL